MFTLLFSSSPAAVLEERGDGLKRGDVVDLLETGEDDGEAKEAEEEEEEEEAEEVEVSLEVEGEGAR